MWSFIIGLSEIIKLRTPVINSNWLKKNTDKEW